MTIGPQNLIYPPIEDPEDQGTGLFPVDFLVEDVLRTGLKWFVTDPNAPDAVFSHLKNAFLNPKYGEAKIQEIVNYLKKYELRIVQHWAMIGEQMPCISIQLLDGAEMVERAGLNDHEGIADAMTVGEGVTGRSEIKYSPISDSLHIGIHTADTPDLTKYIYYLVIYILLLFKSDLQTRGLHLSTFRATDLSKLNEYLPNSIYSRFINFTVQSFARVDAGALPIVKKFVGVNIGDSDTNIGGIAAGIILNDISDIPGQDTEAILPEGI